MLNIENKSSVQLKIFHLAHIAIAHT
jgi:hypothetical protein